MRALVWEGPERLTLEDVPAPEPKAGDVLVRVAAAGICGSDIHGYLGRLRTRLPGLIMGHEFAGTVDAVGPGVRPEWIDRLVTVNPLISCGDCTACHAGRTNLCQHTTFLGIESPGGFAELVAVPARSLIAVPPELEPRAAALAEPLAHALHNVRLGLRHGDARRALVIGGGTIGVLVAQAALLVGVTDVHVVEPHPARRAAAAELGATAVLEPGEEEPSSYDLVLEAVGSERTRRKAAAAARPGGAVVLIGLDEIHSAFDVLDLIRREIVLQGSFAYTAPDFAQALAWIATGDAGLGPLTPALPLAEGPAAFAELAVGPTAQFKTFLAPPAT